MFGLYSSGVKTNADSYFYSYNIDALKRVAMALIEFYEQRRIAVAGGQLSLAQASENNNLDVIKWGDGLRSRLKSNKQITFDPDCLRLIHYRPFVRQWLYYDLNCIWSPYLVPSMFPDHRSANQAIAVPGPGSTRGFSALVTDIAPDLELASKGQVFPRYTYPMKARQLPVPESALADIPEDSPRDMAESHSDDGNDGIHPAIADHPDDDRSSHDLDRRVTQETLDLNDLSATLSIADDHGPIDNITDWCRHRFREHYRSPSITKDDIWAYIYGVLHAPDWRSKYANDLRKGLPRIPFAPDFWAFRTAGQALIDLHLGFESCEPWPVDIETASDADSDSFRISSRMAWARVRDANGKLVDDRSVLQINESCRMVGIPDEAHQYVVNGKTPLEWAIDRLRLTRNNTSGIVNDANTWHAWADDPYNLVLHLQRLVRVSVETARIVASLPASLPDDDPGSH